MRTKIKHKTSITAGKGLKETVKQERVYMMIKRITGDRSATLNLLECLHGCSDFMHGVRLAPNVPT